MPPPVPPMVKLGRRIAGIADACAANARPPSILVMSLRVRRFQADLAHRVFEEQAIFGLLDGVDFRADQFDAVLIEHAGLGQFDGEIQTGLAADSGEQRVGALAGG